MLCSWKDQASKRLSSAARSGTATCRSAKWATARPSSAPGLAISDEGSPNVPLPDNYVYEFIPEQDRQAYLDGHTTPLGLHELQLGQRYLILQTGPHGFYRYNIEDIVEVKRPFFNRTPMIHFVQKSAHGHLDHRREDLRNAGYRSHGPRRRASP